jgi:hypothetical protein
VTRLNELFPAGPRLSEAIQIGRRPTIDTLEERVGDGEKVKLLEPRNTGKSSVAEAVMQRLRRSHRPAATADLSTIGGPVEAADVLRGQLSPGLAAVAGAQRATGWLSDRLSESAESQDRLIADILARLSAAGGGPASVLTEVASAAADGPVGIVFDEAHRLASWPAAEQQALRAFLRADTRVGVIVASSEASALERLTGPGCPLEYVGQRVRLPPIARADWEHELPARFVAAEVPIAPRALGFLLDEAREHPYCTMLLAREAARIGQPIGEVTEVIVRAALLVAAEDEAWGLRDDLG